MKNVPIAMKIMALLGLFGIFVLGVAFYATGQMSSISGNFQSLLNHERATSLGITKAQANLSTIHGGLGDLLVSSTAEGNASAMAKIASARQEFDKTINDTLKIAPASTVPAIESLAARAKQILDATCHTAIVEGDTAVTAAQNTVAHNEYLAHCSPVFLPLLADFRKESAILGAQAIARQKVLVAMTHTTILTTFAGIIIGLVAIGLIAFFGTRAWINRPLRTQLGYMTALSAGQYDIAIEGSERRDEIGAIARAVEGFRDAGREKLRVEAAAGEHRAEAEAARVAQEAERAEIAARTTAVVEQVALGLEKLAEGDLLFRLNRAFSAEYEKLRHDYNAAMERLQETMASISANTHGVRAGAGEISQASDDLSRRTEQQAASLEETAAALDEITATVRRTAENAREARSAAETAQHEATRSGEVVQNTVTAMSGIENSSKQIGNIIGVIDEIAFQTNLLALNAGVEAARAGEAGRGFAVVATEVRALAQRSAEAAKEIKTLISASSRQVESGVQLVGETGTALASIAEQVARLNGIIGEIASSAQEQATGLAEVNTAVNQMDQVTQQNAAMVEQSTAASHSLAREAETLAHLVARFRIEAEGTAARGHEAAPARPAPRAPAESKRALPAEATRKTASRQGEARPAEARPTKARTAEHPTAEGSRPQAARPKAEATSAPRRAPAMAEAEDDGWAEF
ncbi:methyl-accepting chemotaxis protein [Acidisoma sp. C75]